MNIIIPKYISYRTYNYKKENSRTYITDEKNHCFHILEAEASDIYYIIASKIENLESYAEKAGLKDELTDFLQELNEKQLIIQNNTDNFQTKTPIYPLEDIKTHNVENDDILDSEKKQWIFNNGYLPSLDLQITYNCNLKCIHCFNDKNKRDKILTFSQAKSAIEQAFDLGIYSISITGGECTCNKDFLDICKYIKNKHLSFSFLTNGQLLHDDENLFNEIVNLYPHSISLSLYSMDNSVHDEITGVKGSFEKTLNVIKKLKENNIGLIINTPIIKTNLTTYKSVAEFAKQNNIPMSTGANFIDNPKNVNAHLELNENELINLYSDKASPVYVGSKKFDKNNKKEQTICAAGRYQLSILPNADITPCHDFYYKFGNLETDKLADIWKNKAPEFQKLMKYKNLKNCLNEDYCKYCTYCPIEANFKYGFLQRNYNLCKHSKAYMAADKLCK